MTDPNGAVCDVDLGAGASVRSFDACVGGSLRRAATAVPVGGCVEVAVPMSFVRSQP